MKETVLKPAHLKSGAKFTEFAGWNMPVYYTSIIEEHLHTRKEVSIFDVSHMSEFIIEGETATYDLEKLFTREISSMEIGQCKYGFFLNDFGKFIDDAILYRIAEIKFMIVANAGTNEKDERWIKTHISKDTVFTNISDKLSKLDLQGPKSEEVLSESVDTSLKEIKYFHFEKCKIIDIEAIISRTGYTGEDGFEIYFDIDKANIVWERLLSDKRVKPAGLGARDTLRLEVGYPLYGQDITEDYTPVSTNLMNFVDLNKDFIGKETIEKELRGDCPNFFKEKMGLSPKKILAGFEVEGKRIARHGYDILYNGNKIGVVTSGSYSPSLEKSIGLGYINLEFVEKYSDITISNKDIKLYAKIVTPPFLKKNGTVPERGLSQCTI